MDVYYTLRKWEILSHCTDEQIDRLSQCVTLDRHPDATTVIRQGEATRAAYLIVDGAVRIQRNTSFGPYLLATLGAGELFGEASYVDGLPRSGDALTEGETELLCFDSDALAREQESNPLLALALLWAFWRSLSAKLRHSNEHLAQFFSTGTPPPSSPIPGQRPPTGEFQVGMAAKRQLFQEQKLSSMEINFLSTLSREKKLGPGEVIFHEGEPGDRMYVVLEGQVMISKFIPGGGEEALAFLERGDYFGEMALIDNQPRSADAKAHSDGAVVLAIPREVMEGILDIRKVSSARLLSILCSLVAKRLREIDDKIIGWFMLSGGSQGPGEPSRV